MTNTVFMAAFWDLLGGGGGLYHLVLRRDGLSLWSLDARVMATYGTCVKTAHYGERSEEGSGVLESTWKKTQSFPHNTLPRPSSWAINRTHKKCLIYAHSTTKYRNLYCI